MERDRLRKVEDIFDQVLAVSSAERDAALDAACGDDAELKREVASLLANAGTTNGIRAIVATEAASLGAQTHGLAVGRKIGRYKITGLLGEGGMGAVYAATRDDAEFDQQVAIKVLPHALGSPQAIARFRDERQILAALEHRNIVRLLDGGGTEEGLPYIVMERIDGKPLTAYVRERELSIRERVSLVREVCSAIQFAHQNLVIHRDIKPSNILVDVTGTPKLLDFGIAKLTTPDATQEREARTRTGHALFTPEYASPEQARGEAVSTATDVYSLGAVLYELCTGKPPHQADGKNLHEIVRVLSEVEPVRPSVAAPSERQRELAGDLDKIILKALHKEPVHRYASVEHFADDLGRYLDGLPVNAQVATLGYRAKKFFLRNKGGVIAGALIAATLVAATGVALWLAQKADNAAEVAGAERTRAVSEAERATAEAQRAKRAEEKLQTQLDALTRSEAGRKAAETDAAEKTTQVSMTREQLEQALETARAEKRVAEQESKRAREAEQRAEAAAAAEKKAREDAQALYQKEKQRREDAEKAAAEIAKVLPK